MAAPKVILWLPDHPCPYRIQMDVAREFEQISLSVNEDCLVSSLKEVARPALSPIDPPGIAKTEILQDSRKRDVAHLNR